jgi:hypothetical protein
MQISPPFNEKNIVSIHELWVDWPEIGNTSPSGPAGETDRPDAGEVGGIHILAIPWQVPIIEQWTLANGAPR